MHPESLRIARHWLVTGLEKARDFIVLQDDIDWLQSLTPPMLESLALRCHCLWPEKIQFVDIPKDDGSFRHVMIPSVRDRLLVTALVVDNYDAILSNVTCIHTPGIDYQYPLPRNPQDTGWVNEWKNQFRAFSNRARELEEAGQVVLHTDIKNFAPSCDFERLIDSFVLAGWKDQCIETMVKFMEHWGKEGFSGLPQGMVITEILAKAYLSRVDAAMADVRGITYFRYSDDIRIAGADREAVQAGRATLESMLAPLGLRLNRSKTYFSGENSRADAWKIEAVYDPLLQAQGIAQGLKEDVTVPVAILEAVYRQHLSPRRDQPDLPHQTLFNYTINRLSKKNSAIAHPDLAHLMQEHPGKMLDLIRYAVQTGYQDYAGLYETLCDQRLRDYFSYALFHRSTGLHAEGRPIPQEVSALAAQWVKDKRMPDFIRSKAGEVVRLTPHPPSGVDLSLDLQLRA